MTEPNAQGARAGSAPGDGARTPDGGGAGAHAAGPAERAGRRRRRRRGPVSRALHGLGLSRGGPRLLVLAIALAVGLTALGVALSGGWAGTGSRPGPSQPPGSPPVAGQATPSATLPPLPGSSGGSSPGASGDPAVSAGPGASGGPTQAVVARRIRIERLGIDLPIVPGDGFDAPMYKAAHYPGTGWPGGGINIYIYAHAQAGMFLPLWDARVGDVVSLDLADGTTAQYEVTEVLPKVASDALEYTDPTPPERLTLQTSTGYTATSPRFVVLAQPMPAPSTAP